jgi:hypothetical protein
LVTQSDKPAELIRFPQSNDAARRRVYDNGAVIWSRNLECGDPAPLSHVAGSDGFAFRRCRCRSLGYWTFLVVLLDIDP